MYRDYSKMLGRRFFKSDKEGNLVVYKVISFATSDKARVINIKDPNTTFKIPYEELLEDYEMLGPDGNIVFNIVKLNDKYQLRTKDTYSAYIRRLKIQKPRRLSNSALETLAVIAYKQPIMKSEIERIRGVDATPTIKTLISRNLIKIMGHADKIGQPALYATTDDFLKVFNLNSLKDLPNLREIVNITDEPEEMPEEA